MNKAFEILNTIDPKGLEKEKQELIVFYSKYWLQFFYDFRNINIIKKFIFWEKLYNCDNSFCDYNKKFFKLTKENFTKKMGRTKESLFMAIFQIATNDFNEIRNNKYIITETNVNNYKYVWFIDKINIFAEYIWSDVCDINKYQKTISSDWRVSDIQDRKIKLLKIKTFFLGAIEGDSHNLILPGDLNTLFKELYPNIIIE
jgi:hypothetical protein